MLVFWRVISLINVNDRYRNEDDGFLSTALHRNGGDFPEYAVKERANLTKFLCALICLMPSSYSISLLPMTNVSFTPSIVLYKHRLQSSLVPLWYSWFHGFVHHRTHA